MGFLIAKRLGIGLIVIFGASIVVFLVLHAIPGDPVAAKLQGAPATPELIARIRNSLGLNRPLISQYWTFLSHALRGDFGTSYTGGELVSTDLRVSIPPTLELTACSLIIGFVLGITLGATSALRPGTWLDSSIRLFSSICAAMPVFWTGILLLAVFAFGLNWFPGIDGSGLRGLFLPALSLGLASGGVLTRVVRSAMVDASAEPFVDMLDAKGISRPRVVVVHILRSALVPVLAVLGLQLGEALAGAVVIETIFSRSGVGRLLVEAIEAKNYPVVQATMIFIAVGLVLVNILTDVIQMLIDPRIQAAS